jgi:hypothetical protein
MVETPAPKKILFSPEAKAGASAGGVPIVLFRNHSDNVKSALSKFKTAIDYCFINPQAIYQSSFNDKSAKMENKGQKSILEKKANGALKIYSQHSGPGGKLNEEVALKRKKDEAVAMEQKIQSLTDQLAVSESKHLKAEAKAKNIQGDPWEDAQTTNQSHPPSSTTPHPTRKSQQQRIKGGRNSTGGRGQGRGRGANEGRGGRGEVINQLPLPQKVHPALHQAVLIQNHASVCERRKTSHRQAKPSQVSGRACHKAQVWFCSGSLST